MNNFAECPDFPGIALFEIVFEDDSLLVINKPAGLVCHPTKAGPLSSLISRVRLYLGEGIPAHLINRLDRETGGLVLVAKDDATARTLRQQMEARSITKRYLAIVHGWLKGEQGRLEAPLGKDERSAVVIKDCVRLDGAPAATTYRVIRRFNRPEGSFSLLEVHPETGRKHQIRIHLAHLGHAIVGDKIYGPDEQIYLAFVEGRMTRDQEKLLILPYHALHCVEMGVLLAEKNHNFACTPESWFASFSANDTTS